MASEAKKNPIFETNSLTQEEKIYTSKLKKVINLHRKLQDINFTF